MRAITFEYRGIAGEELRSARRIALAGGSEEHRVVRLPDLMESADSGRAFKGLPRTFIPMRNAVFYSVAASYAEEVGAGVLVGGHNKDDSGVFRDVGSRFFGRLTEALREGAVTDEVRGVRILTPLAELAKSEVVGKAAALGVPLRLTWSCHRGGRSHCWRCEGCEARARSFEAAGVEDPLRVK